jgi:hypothetical protein
MADVTSVGLIRLVSTIWTARRDTARNNDLVLQEYEDLHRWAKDDRHKEDQAVEDQMHARRDWGSPLNKDVVKRMRREFATRWRDRKSESQRRIKRLRYSENFIHRLYRSAAGVDWPENPYEADIARLAQPWEDLIAKERL